VQVNELVEQMGVSAVTIRSDLSALESQGLARAATAARA
jgi:DeoR family transcriptional regulator of aga operon